MPSNVPWRNDVIGAAVSQSWTRSHRFGTARCEQSGTTSSIGSVLQLLLVLPLSRYYYPSGRLQNSCNASRTRIYRCSTIPKTHINDNQRQRQSRKV